MKESKRKTLLEVRHEYCPYLLRNETGATISFSTSEGEDLQLLETGDEIGFKFEDDSKRATVKGEKKLRDVVDKHTIVVSLEKKGEV